METSGTSTRPYSCYSSLLQYGSGQYLPIQTPKPVETWPAVYNFAIPRTIYGMGNNVASNDTCVGPCTTYRKFNQLGKSPNFYSN